MSGRAMYLRDLVSAHMAGKIVLPAALRQNIEEELRTGCAPQAPEYSKSKAIGEIMNIVSQHAVKNYLPEHERAALPDSCFAGPGRSYGLRPGHPEDVRAAAYLVGHASDPTAVKENIIRIAQQHNMAHALPEGWTDSINAPSGEGKSLKSYGRDGYGSREWQSLEARKELYWAEYANNFRCPDIKEAALKAYQADNPSGFGFGLLPERLLTAFTVRVEQVCFFRRLAAIMVEETAESLGVLALISEPADFAFTAELAIGSEEVTMTSEKRELKPHPMRAWFRMSKKLLRQSGDAEALRRMGYHLGRTEEKAFLNGSGSDEPLGVFVASPSGIDTSRDVLTATTATLAADDLLNVMSTLPAYVLTAPTAGWVMHRSIFWNNVRSLTDAQGQLLYIPSHQADTELQSFGRLLGLPVYLSEDAPTAVTSGSYVAVAGDFREYGIADRGKPSIEDLVELYALSGQTAILLWQQVDGMPLNAGAFARLKMK